MELLVEQLLRRLIFHKSFPEALESELISRDTLPIAVVGGGQFVIESKLFRAESNFLWCTLNVDSRRLVYITFYRPNQISDGPNQITSRPDQ